MDPDGNPDHDGIVAVAATPNERTAYFGVRGTVPINFQRGQKIVATFYNNSSEEIYLSCRLSFTDPDSPQSGGAGTNLADHVFQRSRP